MKYADAWDTLKEACEQCRDFFAKHESLEFQIRKDVYAVVVQLMNKMEEEYE